MGNQQDIVAECCKAANSSGNNSADVIRLVADYEELSITIWAQGNPNPSRLKTLSPIRSPSLITVI